MAQGKKPVCPPLPENPPPRMVVVLGPGVFFSKHARKFRRPFGGILGTWGNICPFSVRGSPGKKMGKENFRSKKNPGLFFCPLPASKPPLSPEQNFWFPVGKNFFGPPFFPLIQFFRKKEIKSAIWAYPVFFFFFRG